MKVSQLISIVFKILSVYCAIQTLLNPVIKYKLFLLHSGKQSMNLIFDCTYFLLNEILQKHIIVVAGTVVDLDTAETQKIISGQEELLKKVAEDRVDTLDEKSDVVTNYEAGTPVSQGNLYYYYYPVAAYPVNGPHHSTASDKVSSSSSTGLLDGPVLYILVPLKWKYP